MKSLFEWCVENNSTIYKELYSATDDDLSCNISYGSTKKVLWKCNLGHIYEAAPNHRTSSNTGCPYCANKKILKGYNDVVSLYPDIVNEWDYNKNDLLPEDVFPSSNKKYWFICEKGHNYLKEMYHKTNGSGCPYCANQKILVGYNDLATTHPNIALECDLEKNILKPTEVMAGTHRKIWWKCSNGHSYFSSVASRTGLNTGCPYCTNQKVIVGVNDLQTINPELALEWDYENNINSPSEVFPNSNKKAYWICSKGHRYSSVISDRNQGKGCPICSNKIIIKGVNDLFTTHPELETQWDYAKNKVNPFELSYGSNQKVWWKCSNEHSWEAVIHSRTRKNGNGCPICSIALQTSFPEKVLAFYLQQFFEIKLNHKHSDLDNRELDIFIPKYKIAIEYDGDNWHKNYLSDKIKDDLCEKNGIKLIRIREPLCPKYISSAIFIDAENPTNSMKYMENVLYKLIPILRELTGENIILNINVEEDYQQILKMVEMIELTDSILNTKLYDEWNFDKNIGLNPKSFKINSNKKVWWKCSLGHEWYASPNARHGGKSGCPICGNKKVLQGFNDLSTTHPRLVEEWNYDRNGELLPTVVTAGSNKNVWWRCSLGHEWQALISSRSKKNGSNCPICSNQRLLVGYNDLTTTHPKLIEEWDYDSNGEVLPTMVMAGTTKKVWWLCKHGHKWQAYIYSRTKENGSNCPICARAKGKNY